MVAEEVGMEQVDGAFYQPCPQRELEQKALHATLKRLHAPGLLTLRRKLIAAGDRRRARPPPWPRPSYDRDVEAAAARRREEAAKEAVRLEAEE